MNLLIGTITILLTILSLSADVQNTAIDINISDQEYIILSTDSFDSTSVIKKIDYIKAFTGVDLYYLYSSLNSIIEFGFKSTDKF